MSHREIERILERTEIDGVYFLPQADTVILAEISLNSMAEAASQFLYRVLSDFEEEGATPAENFYRRVLKVAIGYFGSKILNPRRKGPTTSTLRSFIRSHSRKRLTGQAKRRRAVAKMALIHEEWLASRVQDHGGRFGRPMRKAYLLDMETGYELSRITGSMLGQSLYGLVIGGKVTTEEVRVIFQRRLSDFVGVWRTVITLNRWHERRE